MANAAKLSQEKASCCRSVCSVVVSMPPKTKAQKRLKEKLLAGQETKHIHLEERESTQQAGPSLESIQVSKEESQDCCRHFSNTLEMPCMDTDDKSMDQSFNLDDSITSDTDRTAEPFCEEWNSSLTWKNGIIRTFSVFSAL